MWVDPPRCSRRNKQELEFEEIRHVFAVVLGVGVLVWYLGRVQNHVLVRMCMICRIGACACLPANSMASIGILLWLDANKNSHSPPNHAEKPRVLRASRSKPRPLFPPP